LAVGGRLTADVAAARVAHVAHVAPVWFVVSQSVSIYMPRSQV